MVSAYIGPKFNVNARKVWYIILHVWLKASAEQFNYICQELGMINIDASIEGEPSVRTNNIFEFLQIGTKLKLFTTQNFKAIVLQHKALNWR